MPLLQHHKFITYHKALAMTEKETDNKNMSRDFQDVSKIGMSHSTLEKMVQKMQISRDPWNVRNIQGSFCDIMSKLKHVKTINLPHQPYRMGVVKTDIWIRCGDKDADFAVFDTGLNKVTQHKYQEIRWANTAQQVSSNEVIVTTSISLHCVNSEGKYLYKIMEGRFTDITLNNNGEVAVVECQQNKVIFLHKKHDKWQPQRHISFHDDDTGTKTLLLSPNDDAVFVAVHWSHRILKLNKETGEILQQYGETKSSEFGNFNGPYLSAIDGFDYVIVSDYLNDRFQVLHPDGKWEEVKVTGLHWIMDVLLIGDNVFILYYDKINENCKLSKYFIE